MANATSLLLDLLAPEAWPRLLRCAACAFMVDPNVIFCGYCYQICDTTEGLEHSSLCRKEFAMVSMTKATALLPVEPIVRQ